MKAKRTWWLIRRGDDGSATYADDDSELDASTLTIYPDGSRVTYQASDEGSVMVSYPADPLLPKLINTIGVNLAKAMGLALDGEPVPVPVVKPTASPVEPEGSSAFDPSAEPTRARVPMLELEPVTEPGLNALNPDERLARDAKPVVSGSAVGNADISFSRASRTTYRKSCWPMRLPRAGLRCPRTA
jgi:hypothetical protein